MSNLNDTKLTDVAGWQPIKPQYKIRKLLLSWLISATALFIAALILPSVSINSFGYALSAFAVLTLLNVLLTPLFAAIKLPFALASGFLVLLAVNSLYLVWISNISKGGLEVDSYWAALLTSLVAAAVSIIIETLFGVNNDDIYSLKVIQRIAEKSKQQIKTTVPGIIFLEIDGLAHPVLETAINNGVVPNMARWIKTGSHKLTNWETDLSSQTGASQAGILLGSNKNIPAFRWVDKKTGRVISCSTSSDCQQIEQTHSNGKGLLANGGASRSNLLSGDAKEIILTVSRLDAEKGSNQGYQAFFANSFNIVRTLVLFVYEIFIELFDNFKSKYKKIEPRGHRGGKYPILRAAVGVFIRDLTIFAVLSDIMHGRPAIYATFAGYDEVAHHSGMNSDDALNVLKKIDQQFERIYKSLNYAPRPYKLVVLSDHGQTQGATFKQRNGYGLDELINRVIQNGNIRQLKSGDENDTVTSKAINEAIGRKPNKVAPTKVNNDIVVLGSGNLGLIYFTGYKERLTLEVIENRYPKLISQLTNHKHIGWLMIKSEKHGPIAIAKNGQKFLLSDKIIGQDPLQQFSPNATRHLLRTDGFNNAPDILINSFYDAKSDEGCAFEELISFHGGMGGAQTKPLLLYPSDLKTPSKPIVGAENLHKVLCGWRKELQN